MDKEVDERLTTAWEYKVHSNSAGTPRSMISQGYLAIDNFLSAVIIESHGGLTTRNHRKKIHQVENDHPDLLDKQDVSFNDIRDYHKVWNDVRYSREPVEVESAIDFNSLIGQVSYAVIGFFARREGIGHEELENQFYSEILGQRWSQVDEAVEAFHEEWQSELEMLSEAGHGSKIGNKILNPSNFSHLEVLTADEATREIISADEELSREVADLYDTFLGLINQIREKRMEEGLPEGEITRFDLSIRLQYIAQDLETITAEFADLLKQALDHGDEGPDHA